MRFKTGKHAGKTYEEVLLKPDFARWYSRKFPDTDLSAAFQDLAKKVNEMPFTVQCRHCANVARRASAYSGTPSLYFWCGDCDPMNSGARQGTLSIVRTMKDALDHVEHTAGGKRKYMRAIVRSLAEAKGLPKRVGEKQAIAFFS